MLVLIWLFILLQVPWSERSAIVSTHPRHPCELTNLELYVVITQRGLPLPAITRRESRQRTRLLKQFSSCIFHHQRSQYLLLVLTTCLLLSGDVNLNPGPMSKFPCARCEQPVHVNQYAYMHMYHAYASWCMYSN